MLANIPLTKDGGIVTFYEIFAVSAAVGLVTTVPCGPTHRHVIFRCHRTSDGLAPAIGPASPGSQLDGLSLPARSPAGRHCHGAWRRAHARGICGCSLSISRVGLIIVLPLAVSLGPDAGRIPLIIHANIRGDITCSSWCTSRLTCPATWTRSGFQKLGEAEAERAIEAINAGQMRKIWRIVGARENYSVWETDTARRVPRADLVFPATPLDERGCHTDHRTSGNQGI